jgi:hypothetical protein
MSPENETETKRQKWERVLVHEFFEYLFNFAFLSFFLVAFAWYRRLILASYDIHFTAYWAPLVEAAILAKVIMIGDALRMGRRLRNWPLAVPTIYRTVVFSVLVVLFSIAEHVGGALFHGKKASEGIAELTNTGWQGLLAWCVLIIAAFLPFFTVKEIERAFGAEKVRGMFFGQHREKSNYPADDSHKTAKLKS